MKVSVPRTIIFLPGKNESRRTDGHVDPAAYALNQVRYDLRELKARGLIERDGRRYAYRLTEKENKVGLLFVLVCRKLNLLTTTSTDDNKAILERIAQMLTKLIKSRRAIE